MEKDKGPQHQGPEFKKHQEQAMQRPGEKPAKQGERSTSNAQPGMRGSGDRSGDSGRRTQHKG